MQSSKWERFFPLLLRIFLDALVYYLSLVIFLLFFPNAGGLWLLLALMLPSSIVYNANWRKLFKVYQQSAQANDAVSIPVDFINTASVAGYHIVSADDLAQLTACRQKIKDDRSQLDKDIAAHQTEYEKVKSDLINERETFSKLIEAETSRIEAEKSNLSEMRKQLIADKSHFYAQSTQAEPLMEALARTETRTLSWLKLREQDEYAFFQQLSDKYGSVGRLAGELVCIDGADFEYKMADLLRLNGYTNVTVTASSHDFGGDITATLGTASYIVQCKYYSKPVGIEAVYEVNAAKTHYKAHCAVVATNNIFTAPARIMAEELGVVLWDCDTIRELLSGKET